MASGNLGGPVLWSSLINPEMELAPDPSLGATWFAGLQVAFAFNLMCLCCRLVCAATTSIAPGVLAAQLADTVPVALRVAGFVTSIVFPLSS